MTANIAALIQEVGDRIDRLKRTTDPRDLTARAERLTLSTLLDIVRQQEERNQQIAAALDGLANELGYPVNSIAATRENIRKVARVVRGEGE